MLHVLLVSWMINFPDTTSHKLSELYVDWDTKPHLYSGVVEMKLEMAREDLREYNEYKNQVSLHDQLQREMEEMRLKRTSH